MTARLAPFFLLLLVNTLWGQLDQQQGLNGLQQVPFTELSQPDNNALGAVALALHPDDWRHAEDEHFIYHYVRSFVATRMSVEAEFNFRIVAQVLQKEQPASDRKSHIYIFDRPEDWLQFQKAGELEPWSGGIQAAGSLFLLSDPSYKFSGNTIGHEVAHLLLYRYYGSHIPCWLNEGFAEFVSRNSRASYQRARGYLAKPHSSSLAPEKLISLAQLMAMTRPPTEQVDIFYDESERLVRFLAHADQARFLELLQVMAGGETFDHALLRIYAGTFASRSDFEEKFGDYATKDYGTELQDQL